MIYLDNAATTLRKPPQVIEAVIAAMTSMGNSARGSHNCALSAARTIYGAREKLASFFGCRPDHVIFTSNSTEALNIAINGILNQGDHVISTDLEHNSVLRPLYRLETERQVALSFVKSNQSGGVDYGEFESLIRPSTKAIICTHASNFTGNCLDIEKIGAIAKAHQLLFVVDAAQTAGVFPINLERMGIDILCFTGHKSLMGPQGTGGMCIRGDVPIRPWKVGGTGVQSYSQTQPEQFPLILEAGTLNGHGIAGLSAALDFLSETGIDHIHRKEQFLAKRFYDSVAKINGLTFYGDFSDWNRAPIVALNVRDFDSGFIADELANSYQIAVRPGAHCAPRLHQALGTVKQGAVRFSFSWFNTENEVDAAIQAVKELAN